MKNKLLIFLVGFVIMPNIINAEQVNYNVTAKCGSNHSYGFLYDNPKSYKCSNGNTSPYTQTIQDTCRELTDKVCNTGTVKKCSVSLNYDCSRTVSGAKFTTTKKTTKKTSSKTTNSTTETTQTTSAVKVSTKLKSITLSSGNIVFNPDLYEYSIKVDSSISSIDITAIPEDSNSKVEIKNNTDLKEGSVISIIVMGSDSSTSEYRINVSKETYIMSSNAKLKSLSVTGYDIGFNSRINDYTITLDNEVSDLDITYETEDDKAVATINGNSNLKDGSKVTISVMAEDGTTSVYTINISIKQKSNFVSVLFIIILILAVVAGAYYIYKKFVQSKSGGKYEYE